MSKPNDRNALWQHGKTPGEIEFPLVIAPLEYGQTADSDRKRAQVRDDWWGRHPFRIDLLPLDIASEPASLCHCPANNIMDTLRSSLGCVYRKTATTWSRLFAATSGQVLDNTNTGLLIHGYEQVPAALENKCHVSARRARTLILLTEKRWIRSRRQQPFVCRSQAMELGEACRRMKRAVVRPLDGPTSLFISWQREGPRSRPDLSLVART